MLAALSLGLVVGPLMGGVLSDATLLGSIASVELPFYGVSVLVVINTAQISGFFRNKRTERRPVKISPLKGFLILWGYTPLARGSCRWSAETS